MVAPNICRSSVWTWFMSLFWNLKFWSCSYVFGKSVDPCIILTWFLLCPWGNLHNLVVWIHPVLLPSLKEHQNTHQVPTNSFPPPFFFNWCWIQVFKMPTKSLCYGRLSISCTISMLWNGHCFCHVLPHQYWLYESILWEKSKQVIRNRNSYRLIDS